MSGWKQTIKSKRWLLVVAVLKQISKENIELNGAHCKGVRNVSSRRVGATTPPTTSCSHRAMQLDILTPQAATGDTSTNGES